MTGIITLGVAAYIVLAAGSGDAAAAARGLSGDPPLVVANDNRRPAGQLADGALILSIRAAAGLWRPEGPDGPAVQIETFGESGGPLQAPAPLIRAPEGTEIVASIRNDLDVLLRVHGLCTRDGGECPPIDVPPSSSRQIRFASGRPGTYHYWATTTGVPLSFRGASDTQLSGAFIVDPAGGASIDRVLVITEWTSITKDQLRQIAAEDDPGQAFLALNPRLLFLINGLSWPATERLTYRRGDCVRWRVVNLSTQPHPMHLHGFYFDVDSLGDGLRDQAFDASNTQRVVTHLMRPGTTMGMTWTPERTGNWLFHCHTTYHIAPERRLAPTADADGASDGHDGHGSRHAAAGMAGMVLGFTVTDPNGDSGAPLPIASAVPARQLTLTMQTEANTYGAQPAYGFALAEAGAAASADTISVPGPPIVLRRGEPVEITLVNRLREATAIHWHGMELDSYYDGVHGWSGAGARVTPLVEPGATFIVRFTPPRAGTFIYHTHMHDDHQLTSGLYGPLLVLEPGETFDAASDHVLVIGKGGPGRTAPTIVNGSREPRLAWKAGMRHRLRFINITADDVVVVSLGTPDTPASWRPLTKDGAPVPAQQSTLRKATQTIAAGETFDFEYDAPPGRLGLWLEVRTPAGRWETQARITIR